MTALTASSRMLKPATAPAEEPAEVTAVTSTATSRDCSREIRMSAGLQTGNPGTCRTDGYPRLRALWARLRVLLAVVSSVPPKMSCEGKCGERARDSRIAEHM